MAVKKETAATEKKETAATEKKETAKKAAAKKAPAKKASAKNAAAEADLTGSFSLANFIQGVFQAVQNHWNQEPNRILISKSN